jgi:hypothetical protein
MKQKTNLTLHKPKTRRKNTSKIQQVLKELLMVPKTTPVKISMQEFKSPKHGIKRLAYRSPHKSKEKTPSKSPNEKKAKKCLMTILDSDKERNLSENAKHICDEKENEDIFRMEDHLESETRDIENEMFELLPSVLTKLAKEGFDQTLLNFFRQISKNEFPLSNISFLLWSEVVKWYSCKGTCFMRYSDETKKFWKLGYRMFGGRFIHFMSGYKNTGHNISAKSGLFSTSYSNINFAVPDTDVLRNYLPYGSISNESNSRRPGIFFDIIESLSKSMSGKSCCITFDGKKLKQGLTKTDGDIDLLGFEKDMSLEEKRGNQKILVNPLKEMLTYLKSEEESCEVNNLASSKLTDLEILLHNSLKNISKQILDIKEKRIKKVYAKEKLIEKSGDSNWRNSKYVYAISATISYIHDIDTYLEHAHNVLEELIQCIAYMNKVSYIDNRALNLEESRQYVKIQNKSNDQKNTRLVQQRSQAWFEARKEARVTGSTIYKAIGLDGLHNQKEYFDNVVCAVPDKEKSDKTKEALKHGTENEVNATATLVGRVLPILYPDKVVHEEGYVEYGLFKEKPFMIISPDGSIKDSVDGSSTIAAVELKCPVQNIHKELPPRYLLQCLSEIEALDVDHLIYLCWKSDVSSVFRVNRNKPLFDRAFNLANRLYGIENPKRCTKLCEDSKSLKQEIIEECKNIKFMFIVPSLTSATSYDTQSCRLEFRLTRLQLLIEDIIKSYDQFYELNRQPATEAVVFLCCDLDREWRDNTIRSAPVCWFPKGYSLDTETMVRILETVLCVCQSYGLHIPAISYDGQWHNICVRDLSGEPLTVLQLQKDIWKRVERMPKSEILKVLKTKNKDPKWQFEVLKDDLRGEHRVIATTRSNEPIPTFSQRIFEQRILEQRKQEKKNKVIQTIVNMSQDSEQVSDSSLNVDEITVDSIIRDHSDNMPNEDANSFGDENRNDVCKKIENITIEDASTILTMIKTDQKCSKSKQWDKKVPTDLLDSFGSAEKLNKMRDCELRIVIRYFNSINIKNKIKETATKQHKVNHLITLFGLDNNEMSFRKKKSTKIHKVKTLKELAFNTISKTYKKNELNIIYAEYVWDQELTAWRKKHFEKSNIDLASANMNYVGNHGGQNASNLICEVMENDDNLIPSELFYTPSKSIKRGQNEVHCIDATHLLTRTRRKCCRGGLEGLSNKPWLRVAKSGNTHLSPAMVDAVVDPMSVSVAITHFSESVEEEMLKNGDNDAAELCNDIRQWWQAEDNPGIPARKRMHMRMGLRKRYVFTFEHKITRKYTL